MAYNPSEKGIRIVTLTPASPPFDLNSWRDLAIETIGTTSYTIRWNAIDPVETRTDTQGIFTYEGSDQKNKDINDPLQIICLTGSIVIHFLQNP